MVLVKVKFTGTLKQATGIEEDTLFFSEAVDVAQVIKRVLEEYDERLESKLIDPVLKNPHPNTLLLLNGTEVNNLQGLSTKVEDRDVLTLLPVSHGG